MDWVNLTQGQLLVKYWWLWAIVLVVAISFSEYFRKK
jgi:hypothetical protein